MWNRSPAAFAIAIALLVPSGSAHAESFAEVSITGLSLSFVDLLSSDGVSPSVIITEAQAYGRGSARVSGPGDELDTTVIRRHSTLDPVTAAAPVPSDFAASALVSFQGGQVGSLIGEAYAGEINGTSRATGHVDYDFILSPNTSMTIRATLSGTAFSSGIPVGSNGQFGFFQAIMSFTSQGGGLDRVFSISATASPLAPDYSFLQVSDATTVEYTFTNATNFPLAGHVMSQVDSYVQNAAIAAVPEQSTQVLLLAGLAAFGLAARRPSRS